MKQFQSNNCSYYCFYYFQYFVTFIIRIIIIFNTVIVIKLSILRFVVDRNTTRLPHQSNNQHDTFQRNRAVVNAN